MGVYISRMAEVIAPRTADPSEAPDAAEAPDGTAGSGGHGIGGRPAGTPPGGDTPPDQAPPGGDALPGEPPRSGWRASLRWGLTVWPAGLLAYVLVTLVAWLPFEQLRDPPATFHDLLENWHRWDTTWYVMIAESGYHADERSAAFFPLYPMLVWPVDRVLPGDALPAALLVSALACAAALVLVHRLTAELLDGETAKRTIFYLLAFPTGFFLIAAYNESLFIALCAASLYCMRRGRWWMAGILAGLASGTRLAGVLLALAYAYEYLRQRGFSPRRLRPDALGILLTPLGLVGYALYCWRSFGDPLFFEHAQSVWFRSGYTFPWVTVVDVLRLIIHGHPLTSPTEIRNIINLGTALGVLLLLYLALDGRWRLGRKQAYLVLFAAADIMLPLISPIHTDYPLSSEWRFALECLPVFMVLGRMGRSPTFDRFFLMAALPVQGVMVLTFVQNQFVA